MKARSDLRCGFEIPLIMTAFLWGMSRLSFPNYRLSGTGYMSFFLMLFCSLSSWRDSKIGVREAGMTGSSTQGARGSLK